MFKKSLSFILSVMCLPNVGVASDWYVDTNSDLDLDTCVAEEIDNDDDCTLRDAVSQVVDGDNIYFLEDLSGVSKITLDTIPVTLSTNNVTVDATRGSKTVEITAGASVDGIYVTGDGVTVKGLYLTGFSETALQVSGDSDVIDSNIIGLSTDESVDGSVKGISVLGTNTSVIGNTVSGNTQGIYVGSGSADTTISGNYIGTDTAGGKSDATDRGNTTGILVDTGGNLTGAALEGLIIGGLAAEKNVISDNSSSGIQFYDDNGNMSGDVSILNNYIGVEVDGSSSLGNSGVGVWVQGAVDTFADNVDFTIQDNVISNNSSAGVYVTSANTVTVDSNMVGVDVAGTTAAGNSGGVNVTADTAVTISDNVISNDSSSHGVTVLGGPIVSITGNKIGVDSAGANDMGNFQSGIYISSPDTTSLTIGGEATDRNVVSNNGSDGIRIVDIAATGVINVINNLIGVEGDGATAAGNSQYGVYIGDGQTITVGGDQSTRGNVISNNSIGLGFNGGEAVTIQGNYIGTTSSGLVAAGNSSLGISITSLLTTALTIGGEADGLGNVISANAAGGINLVTLATTSTPVSIFGNIIGLGVDGVISASMGNGYGIQAATGALTVGGANRLGADGAGQLYTGNIISNSTSGSGINIGNGVESFEGYGNVIGLKKGAVSGVYDTAAGNADQGIFVNSNSITSFILGAVSEGSEWATRNVIAGSNNDDAGVLFSSCSALSMATIKNNYIGTDYLGTGAVPNTYGISVLTTPDATFNIGGTGTGEGNLISGNASSGLAFGTGLVWNILGNYIGTNAAGTAALANGGSGISIYGGTATYNIGNTIDSGKNVISGNIGAGLSVSATSLDSLEVKGNYIGTDVSGEVAIGNGSDTQSGLFNFGGVYLSSDGSGYVIGTDSDGSNDSVEGNVISGNYGHGILAIVSNGLVIAGNKIGLSAGGSPLGNVDGVGGSVEEVNGSGIALLDVSAGGTGTVNATKIGTNSLVTSVIANARNYISANEGNGIAVYHFAGMGLDGLGQDWDDGYIRNNYIGVSTAGAASSPYANGDYEIFVDSNQTDLITNFSISGANLINNDSHLAVYILDVAQAYISNLSTMDNDNEWADTVCPIAYRYLELWTTGGAEADYYRPLSLACPISTGGQGAPALLSVSAGGGANDNNNNTVTVTVTEDVIVEDLEVVEDIQDGEDIAGEDVQNVDQELVTDQVVESVVEVGDEVVQEELEILTEATGTASDYVYEVAFNSEIPKLNGTQLEAIQNLIDAAEQESNVFEETELTKAVSQGVDSLSEQELEDLHSILGVYMVNNLEDMISGGGVLLPRYGKKTLNVNSLDDLELHMDEIVDGIMYGGADYDQNGIADLIQLQYGESGALFVNNKDGDEFRDADEMAFGLDITKYDEFPDMKITIVGFEDDGVIKTSDKPLIKGLSKSAGSVYDVNFDSETGKIEIKEVLGDFQSDEEGKWTLELEDSLNLGQHYLVGINDEGYVDFVEIEVVDEDLVVSEISLDEDSSAIKSGKILSGLTEPGSIVYVTWKSVIFSSVIIADASEGRFEAVLPEDLLDGNHEVLVFAYDPSAGIVGNVASMIFNR